MQQKQQVKQKTGKPGVAAASQGRWQLWLAAGCVAVVTFLSLSPILSNSFINQDDNLYVFDNVHLGKPLPEAITYFFGLHYFSGNYVPVTMIAYALVYHMAGSGPEFYHTASLLVHCCNVLLVFYFIYLLSRKKLLVAAIVALFFGIHPMHVESVAWAAELKDMLYTFFFMAGLIAYLKYLEWHLNNKALSPPAKNSIHSFPFIPFVFFALAVLSKSAAAIFPVVLLLLDFYSGRKADRKAWLEKMPFFVVSVIIGIIAIRAQQADDLINNHFPPDQKVLYASYAILDYLGKFILPVHLSNFYPYPRLDGGHVPYLFYAAPLVVAALFYGVYRSLRRSRLIAFGFLFFAANLVMVLQLVSVGNAIVADRYTYVPYIGLLFILAMWFEQFYQGTSQKLKPYKPYLVAAVIALAITCSYLSYTRSQVWETQDTLAEDLLKKFPDDPIALNNQGYLLFLKGNYAEAAALFSKAIQLKPGYVQSDYIKAYVNLTNCYLVQNDLAGATRVADSGLAYAPNDHATLNKRGYLYYMRHQYADALRYYKAALASKKDDLNVLLNMAQCYMDLKDYENNTKTLDLALKYHPDNVLLLNNKGYSLMLKGNYPEAIAWFKACLELKPDFRTAMENMANCHRAMGTSPAAQ